MSDRRQDLLTQLGFRFGSNGPHAARTMMLDDLQVLLTAAPKTRLLKSPDRLCSSMSAGYCLLGLAQGLSR